MSRCASVNSALLHTSHVRVQKGSLLILSVVQVGMLGDVSEEIFALSRMCPSRRVSASQPSEDEVDMSRWGVPTSFVDR